jgi:hypothetical protein
MRNLPVTGTLAFSLAIAVAAGVSRYAATALQTMADSPRDVFLQRVDECGTAPTAGSRPAA